MTAHEPSDPAQRPIGEYDATSLRDPAIRVVMMPRDTNPQGTIFGGVILSLIDQAAFVHALMLADHRYVTVAIDSVEFHKPVYVGDVVSLCCETMKIGNTSIRVHVVVFAQRRDRPHPVRVTEAQVTLVAIDERGEKVPITMRKK
ncbi:MAG: acyl-CoA thioesterase [Phycisphaerales bacterium]